MSNAMAECMLGALAPALRGLFAQPTGDADVPWQPVILRTMTDPESREYAEGPGKAALPASLNQPPLVVEPMAEGETPQSWRGQAAEAFTQFTQEHGASPTAVCVRQRGIVMPAPEDAATSSLPLHQRVALVTGAAGAIGRGICRRLLEQGAYVAGADLPGEALEHFRDEFEAEFGQRIIATPIDVTSEESVKHGFTQICLAWGGVDIVVLNAGIAHVAALTELTLAAFQKLEQVNVDGTLLTLAEAARIMQLQHTGGDIVLVSTKNVFAPGARFGAYSATKAASHQLARIASLELAEFGIRVNMVAPDGVFSDDGKTKSGLWATVGPDRMKARGLDEGGLEEYYRNRNLLKMRVTSRHVANAVLFFVTHQTPTTGATIPIDGGLPDATPR